MAKVGMRHLVYAPITAESSGSAITYGAGAIMGKAVRGAVTYNRNDNPLYGDDVIAENDNGVTGYQLEVETTTLVPAIEKAVLGLAQNVDVYTVTDASAPYVGVGYLQVIIRNGVTIFRGVWYYKVQFGLESEETQTRQQNIEWSVPSLSGTGFGVYIDASGHAAFRQQKEFSSAADAEAWLDTLANIGSDPFDAITVASAAGTNSGYTALTISGYTPAAGESYVVKDQATNAPTIAYHDVPDYTWNAWDGSSDVLATNGNKIAVVSLDAEGRAIAYGSTTVVAHA